MKRKTSVKKAAISLIFIVLCVAAVFAVGSLFRKEPESKYPKNCDFWTMTEEDKIAWSKVEFDPANMTEEQRIAWICVNEEAEYHDAAEIDPNFPQE